MKKFKRKAGIFCILCILMCCMLCTDTPAFANNDKPEEQTEIRVGYTDNDNMVKQDSDGNFYGYGVSYLDELAKYTRWSYQYVKVSEDRQIDELLSGEIDLLCGLHLDCWESGELVFSQEYAGLEYGMLCALKDNHGIFYNDYASIDGKKIGINKNEDLEQKLLDYAAEHAISYEPVYFDEYEAMRAALEDKSIDIMLTSSLRELENCKYVGKAGNAKEYFAVHKENAALMEALNVADTKLKEERPFYISSIYEIFFGVPYQRLTGITREEYEFISSGRTIKVACDANSYPLEYVDAQTGEYAGVYAEALELISKESGLQFEFIPLENFSEAWDMMANGEADLIPGNYGNSKTAEYYDMTYSQSYLSAEYTLIGGKELEVGNGMSLALPRNYVGLRYYFQQEEPTWKIVLYDSIEDCMKAVDDGEADVTSVNSIFLQTVYNLNHYDNLKILPNLTKSVPISIGIGNNDTEVLKSILDKAIYQIPDSEFEKCIAEQAINISYEPSLLETIERVFPYICAGLLVIVAAAAMIIRRREKHFQYLAMTDSVTGLWNRVKFYQEAQDILEKNPDKTYLLITLDINKFKFINNDFGSKAGDKFLWVLGERLRNIFRGKGCYARNTADMFLVLIEETLYREEMLEPLSEAIYFDNNGKRQYYKVAVKAGIRRICPEDDRADITRYVDQASIARKTIKDSVHTNQAYYDENMKRTLEKENAIEKRMEAALQNEEFQVYLQPKYDLRTERIIGAEALVRWIDPEKGMIPPDQFIPLFEKNGFILKVDFYVYEQVMKQMEKWRRQGKPPICVSVNVSRVHIGTLDFFDKLNQLVERYHIPKECFELELTETIMGGEKSLTRTFIRDCKKEGYQVSIDDFGSGYSSLNLLKDLPVDILKIDKGFLEETEESKRSTIIVEQVVEMAKRMEIGTLCEGVETTKQAVFLKRIGCDMAQGYLFSRPLPMKEFAKMI